MGAMFMRTERQISDTGWNKLVKRSESYGDVVILDKKVKLILCRQES